jgi:hypothetical protein
MDTRKTVGTTTLSASGGSVIGVAVATILFSVLPLEQSPAMFGAVGIVCSAIFAVGAGYLSPSKAEALAPYLDQASEDIAQRVATKAPTAQVPSAQEVAEAVAVRTDAKTTGAAKERGSYVGQHAIPESAPAAVEPGLEAAGDYPDLDGLARVDGV